MNKSQGFTLIELLVVIAIIAILVAFVSVNFVGARQRANDVKRKGELQQVKTALRLYYNDFNTYPGPAIQSNNTFNGCGTATPPASNCLTTCSGVFGAGGTGCSNVYMKLLPPASDYTWSYRQVSSGDDFCMWTTLNNASDTEIAKSQLKCSASCTGIAPAGSYVLCSD